MNYLIFFASSSTLWLSMSGKSSFILQLKNKLLKQKEDSKIADLRQGATLQSYENADDGYFSLNCFASVNCCPCSKSAPTYQSQVANTVLDRQSCLFTMVEEGCTFGEESAEDWLDAGRQTRDNFLCLLKLWSCSCSTPNLNWES